MGKQIKRFTTDPHLIKQTLSNYSNTFVAFKELVVNSMQASAKNIKITFEGDSTLRPRRPKHPKHTRGVL